MVTVPVWTLLTTAAPAERLHVKQRIKSDPPNEQKEILI